MGGEFFTNEDGEFLYEVRRGDGELVGYIEATNLEPDEELYAELLRGDHR